MLSDTVTVLIVVFRGSLVIPEVVSVEMTGILLPLKSIGAAVTGFNSSSVTISAAVVVDIVDDFVITKGWRVGSTVVVDFFKMVMSVVDCSKNMSVDSVDVGGCIVLAPSNVGTSSMAVSPNVVDFEDVSIGSNGKM